MMILCYIDCISLRKYITQREMNNHSNI